MDAKALINEIQEEKRKAIESGILREEKPLVAIAEKDIPRKLPNGWQWCRLGDYAMKVTDYVASGSFASLKENVLITNEENYAVMVKTADFANGFTRNLTYTDKHGYQFLENSNLFGGELILSNIGSIGKVFIVPDLQRPMTLASNTIMIRMTHNEYNRYMYYMFTSSFGQKLLMSISSGTSMLKFNKTQLKSTIIPIAPLEKQRAICDILDRIQKIISDRKIELKRLDDLIKARFVELFGTYPANEKGWNTGTIRDLVTEVRYGSSRKAADGESGKYPYLRMNNITYNGELDLTDTKTIDIPDEELDKCTVRRGDLLFNRTNSKELVGKTCVYNRDEMMVLAGFVVRVRLNDRALPEFVSAFMNTDFSKQMLLGMCKAAIGQANINAQELQNIGIYIPPIQIQKDFVSFKAQVDKSKVVIQKALDEAQILFDSLMQQYFG